MYSLMCDFPIISKIEIIIESKNLLNFTKRQLKHYIVSETKLDINSDNFLRIEVENDFKNLKFEDIVLGREIKFKENTFHISKNSRVQKIGYRYNFDSKLILEIDFKKKFLYYIKNMLVSNYSMNHILFYETVLYPIFSLYALKNNYFLVHGSLLKIRDKYIVLAGLDGVGKSSLSNELVLKGAKILADNFVFFNGESFFGLNMPIRLDLENKTDENIIYKDNNLKEILYEDILTESVYVDEVYFMSISDNFKIKKLDSNIAMQNWSMINNGAGEILAGNLFSMPFLYQNIFNKQIEYKKINFYHLAIPKGKIHEAIKEIM